MSAPAHDPERFLATEHLIDDLAGRSIRGGAITAISQIAKIAIQFGAVLLLARLLTPDAFGLIAIAAPVLAFFELFRALSGRRTIEQVRALAWDGDPEPHLGLFAPYPMPASPLAE